jgi:hypothetical protein
MDEFPDSTYYFADPFTLPDGTMMVKAGVCVGGTTHEMQLPVLDHRNKPIANPNAFDFNSAQMRCLVKAIGMHGVGISLYLGNMKDVVSQSGYDKAMSFIDTGDAMGFHGLIHGMSEQEQVDLFNSAPPGAKTAFKSSHRAMISQAEAYFKEVLAAIHDAIEKGDELLLDETISELSTYERSVVWGRIDEEQQSSIRNMRNK